MKFQITSTNPSTRFHSLKGVLSLSKDKFQMNPNDQNSNALNINRFDHLNIGTWNLFGACPSPMIFYMWAASPLVENLGFGILLP